MNYSLTINRKRHRIRTLEIPDGPTRKYKREKEHANYRTDPAKKELQRVTEQLASRDCELAEAAASGTNLQSVMDAIGQNAADCVMKSNTVVWRVDGKVKHILALFG